MINDTVWHKNVINSFHIFPENCLCLYVDMIMFSPIVKPIVNDLRPKK